MTDRPTCKTCRFWARETRDDAPYMEAECRVGSPVFVTGFRLAVWPTTEHTKWCACHQPMPPVTAPKVCPGCDDTRPHVHIARFEDNGINTHEWIEKVYADEPPPKPFYSPCTCPRTPGTHEHVEGFCL